MYATECSLVSRSSRRLACICGRLWPLINYDRRECRNCIRRCNARPRCVVIALLVSDVNARATLVGKGKEKADRARVSKGESTGDTNVQSENPLRTGLVSPSMADLRHPGLAPPRPLIMASERNVPARQGCQFPSAQITPAVFQPRKNQLARCSGTRSDYETRERACTRISNARLNRREEENRGRSIDPDNRASSATIFQ